MKTIEAKIERATDGTFSVYCLEEMFSGVGDTIEEAKEDMQAQIEFYVEHCKEEGKAYPDWLDENYRIEYQLDVPSISAILRGGDYAGCFGAVIGNQSETDLELCARKIETPAGTVGENTDGITQAGCGIFCHFVAVVV